jgi:TolB-like protein
MIVMRNRLMTGLLLFLLLLLAMALPREARTAPRKVLIVPFSIHSDKDLTFLRKGITAMLSSRLTDMGKVMVIDEASVADIVKGLPTPLTREAAADAGRQAGADYVAFGSLTVFGDSISTDARFLEAATASLLVTFNETGQTQGDVIGHINQFAAEVNTRVFGRTSDTGGVRASAPAAPPAAPADPQQQNPEKQIYSGDGGMRLQASDPDTDVTGAKLWRSRRFNMNVNGVALGDVDGDGAVETVFASKDAFALYRFKEGRFLKITETTDEPDFVCVAVDVADINANGREEIFLIGRTEKYWPKTVVLEWDGSRFETVQTITSWFVRVQRDPKTGRKVLYGQKGDTRDNSLGKRDVITPVVRGPLYRMAWIEGAYTPQESYPIPDKGTVFGFAHGDVTGDGLEDWLTYTDNERLQLTSPGNKQEDWTSSEPYGGSYDFLISAGVYRQRAATDYADPDRLPMEVFFVPQRILLADFDKDGRNDVFVVQNYDITRGLMQRSRSYRDGRFECLAWDNVGLRTLWRTRKFSGFISDFYLGDFDNDGQDELVFVVVKKVGDPITGDSKSYLVSWNPYQSKGREPAQD